MRRWICSLGLAAAMVAAGGSAAIAQTSWDNGAGTLSWGDFNNWSPNGNPIGTAVTIGNLAAAANDTTLVDATYVVTSLTITNGADVVNSPNGGATAFELEVIGATTISGAGSSFIVFGGNPDGLDTGTLTINSGGDLILNSQEAAGIAVVEVDSGALTNNVGGLIIGNGRIDLENMVVGVTTLLNNEGTLTATHHGIVIGQPPASTLRITATDLEARVDLDGAVTNAGVVNVNRNATLDVDVPLSDGFGGDLNLAAGATLDISSPWAINAGTVDVNTPGAIVGTGGPAARFAGAAITMIGGTLTLNDGLDSLVFDAAFTGELGAIVNHGSITFNAPATIGSGVNFDMNGDAARLVVNSTVNIDVVDFNLDGIGGAGNVTTINAGGNLDLDLGAGADEDFGHTININGGELDVTTADNDWSLNAVGTINAGGAATSFVNGETLHVTGTGGFNVGAFAELRVNAATVITGAAHFDVAADGALNFGTVTYANAGATFTGDGYLFKGVATVDAATTWNVAVVDLDDGATTLNADLTINADQIDVNGNRTSSIVTINDPAVLTVNLTGGDHWTLAQAGSITYNGNASPNTFLAGSDVEIEGTINNVGDGRIDARLDVDATGVINIATVGEELRLSGGNVTDNPNTIAGGVINGPGILRVESGSSLRGFGTINATVNFVENSDLYADNGTLTVAGAILDINIFGITADGIANVTNPWNTDSVGAVSMFGGELAGALITNDGGLGIGGRGLISARVINNTRIRGTNGGTLVIETPGNDNDWDGAGAGRLWADGADLELRDTTTFLFSGEVQVNAGRQVFANGFELEFEPGSALTLTNGVYQSTHATNFGGALVVNAGGGSVIQTGDTLIFDTGSTVALAGNLDLENETTIVQVGVAFSGAGKLINGQERVITPEATAEIGVLFENHGIHAVAGAAVGRNDFVDYILTDTGRIEMDINGPGIGTFDRMFVDGQIELDGALDLNLGGGYVPALNDLFTIISAPGGVMGQFAEVTQPAGMPAGLLFDAEYNDIQFVRLRVVNAPIYSADFDLDGDVDADDLIVWQGAFGTGDGADADDDGDSDGADFLAWQQQLGSGLAAKAALGTVPEPTSLWFATMAVAGLAVRRRATRRRADD